MVAKTGCQIDLGCILLSIDKDLSLSLLESSNVGLVDFTLFLQLCQYIFC